MSTLPALISRPLKSSISRRSRWASGTPRVWMPTSATRSSSGFPSTISCAIRRRLFAIACSSSSVFGLVCAGSGNRSPFRPHGTELKDVERVGAYSRCRTATRPSSVRDELVRLAQRFDRLERGLERGFRDEHLLRRVLRFCRMVVHGRLELRADSGGLEDRLQLLGLGDVAGDGDLNHASHHVPSSTVAATGSPLVGEVPCLWVAPPFTSSGDPRS